MRDPLLHGLQRTELSTQIYRHLSDAVEAIEAALETPPVPSEPVS
ncbi:hypothetical protein AB0D46_00115 [Streptomyces sp. NPDC048383]